MAIPIDPMTNTEEGRPPRRTALTLSFRQDEFIREKAESKSTTIANIIRTMIDADIKRDETKVKRRKA